MEMRRLLHHKLVVIKSFSVLNSDEGDVCGESVPTNDVGTTHIERDTQNPESGIKNDGNEHVGSGSSKAANDKIQEEERLWSRFQRLKKDSLNKSQDDSDDESEVEEYPPYDSTRISSIGGGFSLEDDGLDCYDYNNPQFSSM
ncbi:hypothetical protein Tco_0626447 [Tanacetum coccineum]|uniref:Uncharacterized protein n=1 Tax=Tanacetum coccineum TaxID=301880 RepID=A0ABQ4WJN2_9ASTR